MNDEIIIYKSKDGIIKVDVLFADETVWLTQEQMSVLFQRDKSVISRHIRNIFEEGELQEDVVVAKNAITTQHGALENRGTTVRDSRLYNTPRSYANTQPHRLHSFRISFGGILPSLITLMVTSSFAQIGSFISRLLVYKLVL